jgi:hypothetical protein
MKPNNNKNGNQTHQIYKSSHSLKINLQILTKNLHLNPLHHITNSLQFSHTVNQDCINKRKLKCEQSKQI